mgnify:CR=1 FL=1
MVINAAKYSIVRNAFSSGIMYLSLLGGPISPDKLQGWQTSLTSVNFDIWELEKRRLFLNLKIKSRNSFVNVDVLVIRGISDVK